jgi:hypothetical protein
MTFMASSSTVPSLASLPREERNAHLLEAARRGVFDFLDFGTHKAGGIRLGESIGGRFGLGVEIDDPKAVNALRRGDAVYSGDVFEFPLTDPVFRFGICRHVLEHLPNLGVVRAVVEKIAGLCREFLYIEGPDFTTERILSRLGLTMAHSTTRLHTCHVTAAEVGAILSNCGFEHVLLGHKIRIDDSANPWVHALGSPPNRSKWQESDLPKPYVSFEPPIYRDFVLLADVSEQGTDLEALTPLLPRARFQLA